MFSSYFNYNQNGKVNEIRAERLARTANPLALVAQQQPVYHPQNHPTHYTQNSSTISQQAATRNRGKAIINSPPPIYDQKPSMVAKDDEMSKDKEIDKLMALISLSFKKSTNLPTTTFKLHQTPVEKIRIILQGLAEVLGTGYDNERLGNVAGARETIGTTIVQKSRIQCYNCKEYGHVARECQKPKRAKDAAYHKEKMLLCKQEEAGFQLNAEQADWKDDTDDEPKDQELEAHYMYMAEIQEVNQDAADDSGPIFDSEPLQKVPNNDNYNVFATESEHLEQSKSVNDAYPIEHDEHNMIIDSMDISYDREQVDQDDDDDLANERDLLASLIEKLKCKIDDNKNRNKFLETSNKALVDNLKGEIEDFKNKNKSLESLNNHFKEANNDLSKTNQLMYKDLKKFQAELDRHNDVKIYADLEKFHLCLKEEMVADLRYFNSLELEVDSLKYQLETQKTQFLNEIGRLSREYYYADHTNAILGVYNKLDEVTNLQCDYLETLEKCKCLEKELSKSKMMSKSFEAFQKHAINLELDLQQYRVMLNNSQGKKQEEEDHHRNVKFSKNKTSVTACNDSLNAKTSNVHFVCATYGKYVLNVKHDMCVLHSFNGVNSRTKMPIAVPVSTREPKRIVNQSVAKPLRRIVALESTIQKPRHTTRKLYEHVSKACSWWYPKFTPPGYKWKPKSQIGNITPKVSMPLGNASRTANIFVSLKKSNKNVVSPKNVIGLISQCQSCNLIG
nr:hypothetical protein [Tanacetum cinerariifolium]